MKSVVQFTVLGIPKRFFLKWNNGKMYMSQKKEWDNTAETGQI